MTPYTPAFFRSVADGSSRSARAVVPLLAAAVGPRSVVDVGCGWGAWLAEFRRAGVADVFGVDGPHVDPAQTALAAGEFLAHDLTRPLALGRRFELALALEVAEHLPPGAADTLVDTLVALAPVVAFSAAVPGQGGTGHLNEQWPTYWAGRFAARGYVAVDALRPLVWSRPDVEWWYAQNLLVFARPEAVVASPALARAFAETRPGMLAVVHPRCFRRYTGEPETGGPDAAG